MQVVTLNSWITEFYQQLLKEFFETINPASSGKIPSSLIYFIPCWVRCEWILQGYYALFSKLSLSSIYMLRACNLIFLGFRWWHYLHIPFFFDLHEGHHWPDTSISFICMWCLFIKVNSFYIVCFFFLWNTHLIFQ